MPPTATGPPHALPLHPSYHGPSEREKIMGMSGISFVVIFFLTNVASVVFSALMMGAALVAVHGATRVPDDLFLDDADVSAGQAADWSVLPTIGMRVVLMCTATDIGRVFSAV